MPAQLPRCRASVSPAQTCRALAEFGLLSRWIMAATFSVFATVVTPVSRAQTPSSAVEVTPIVEREIAGGQSFVGTVMPLRMSIVGSAADQRVAEFAVDEGDRVEKSQVLCKLSTKTLEIELAAARAELPV